MKRWVGPLLLVIVFFFCLLGNLPVSCQHPAYSRSHLEVDLQDYFPIAPANGYQMAMLWSGGYITVTGRKYSIAGEDGIVACEIQAGDLRSNAYFLVRSTGIYMARNRGDLKESRECLFLPGRAEPGQHWNSTIDGEAFEATFLAKISEFSKVPGDYVVVKFVRLGEKADEWFEYVLERNKGPVFIQYRIGSGNCQTAQVGLAARESFFAEHFHFLGEKGRK